MNCVGMDVFKKKSMITIMLLFGEVVVSPCALTCALPTRCRKARRRDGQFYGTGIVNTRKKSPQTVRFAGISGTGNVTRIHNVKVTETHQLSIPCDEYSDRDTICIL